MHTHSDISALLNKTTEALRSKNLGNELESEDTFQCLFAARLMLEALSHEATQSELNAACGEIEDALNQLNVTISPYAEAKSDVNAMITQIEQIKLTIRN
ncbi:MAG: hypothetical protein OQJ97_05845 [Rhodospirillales bacterium]|nr:hypothetical protein [Rhodospirillales bacterium]